MCSGPGSPFGLEDKAPDPPGCLTLKDLQMLHILTKKKLEVWTLQATSFFGGWLLLFFHNNSETKGDLYKILKSGKILRNHGPV